MLTAGVSNVRTDRQRASERRYYERNRDRIRAKNAAYQKAHPEKHAVYSKRWRKSHAAQWRDYMRTPARRIQTYKKAASRRRIAWSLPDALTVDLLTDLCFYCHAAPAPTNGIDRVDNNRGYEYGNVVTACAECNRAKGTRTREQFEQHAMRVVGVLSAF